MRRLLLIGAAALGVVTLAAPSGAVVVINEIYYDSPGADAGEFVEIKGDPGLSLDGYTLVGINGADGATYRTIVLDGLVIPADGYFVVAQDNTVPNFDVIAAGTWQNGSDEIELQLLSVTVDGVCYGSTPLLVCEGTAAPDVLEGHSLSRCPDGVDTGNNADDFDDTTTRTPGETNNCAGPPPPLDVTVCQLKETDANGVSLLLGERVRVTDLVALVGTGVFRAPGTGLLIHVMQDTGEAQFTDCCTALFDTAYPDLTNPIIEGDVISEVIGTVTQFNGLTEITAIEVLTLAGSTSLPAAEKISALELSTNGEIYESCLIEICGLSLEAGATWPAANSNATLNVVDATGTTQMFVDRDTDIDGSAQPIEPFTATGIASQFDTSSPYTQGYQIVPRRRADILDEVDCPVPASEQTWGQLKGLYR